jgi:hypothetical protein
MPIPRVFTIALLLTATTLFAQSPPPVHAGGNVLNRTQRESPSQPRIARR